jgi:hypothetical protein
MLTWCSEIHLSPKIVAPNWVYNMLKGVGTFINRPTQTGGKLYDKFFVYVPTEVAMDGTFPFKKNERVKVRIDVESKKLIIEKVE